MMRILLVLDQCRLIFIVLAYQLDAVVLAQQLRKRFLDQVRVLYCIINGCSFIIVTYMPNKLIPWGCLHIAGHDLGAKGAI
jgi:hypothetical protein